jgi:uncharacterized protein
MLMEPRLSLVTLGVADLPRAVAFYENVVGWKPAASPSGVTFFDLNGVVLSLFPHQDLAEDMGEAPSGGHADGYQGFSLAHNVRSKEEVDAIFARLKQNGAVIVKQPQQASWGGYSGYFADPEGHRWEVAFNPYWTVKSDGRILMAAETDKLS